MVKKNKKITIISWNKTSGNIIVIMKNVLTQNVGIKSNYNKIRSNKVIIMKNVLNQRRLPDI